jgi:hypothetical protein
VPKASATALATTPGEFIWFERDMQPAITRQGRTISRNAPATNQPALIPKLELQA